MKMKFTLLCSLFFLLFYAQTTFAQTAGDFRSIVVSGDWNTAGTWQTYAAGAWGQGGGPCVGGSENIESMPGESGFIGANTSLENVVVSSGAMLGLAGSFTYTLINNGTANSISNTGNITILNGATLSGAGTLLNNAGGKLTVELSSYLAVPTINNGTVTFQQSSALQGATLTNNSTANWINNVYLLSSAIFINNNSLSVTGPVNVPTSTTGTLTNAAGGVIFLTDATANLAVASAITFTNSGTVKGFGTADFATTTGSSTGTIAPGNNTPAKLTITPASGAGTPTYALKLFPGGGTPTAGTTYDQLAVSGAGAVSFAASTLTVTDAASGDALNTVYTLLTVPAGSISALPGTVNLPPSLGSLTNTGTSITATRIVVLPLNWGSFTVMADGGQAHLSWTTLQESNTARFTIERSADGVSYTAIGTVAAKGNSSTVSSYSFTDANPSQHGFNYYRLAETDLDGKSNYSLIRVINFGKGNSVTVQTSPNPVKDLLNIVVQEDNITILLSDMSGRTLKTLRLAQGFHQTSIGDLTKGVYQLTIYKGPNRIDSRQILKF